MRYMMFIKHSEHYKFEEIPQSLFGAMGQLVEAGFKSGQLVDTAGLQRTDKGFRIRLAKGKLTTTDGPFTEAKEVVGGYAIVNAKDRQDAEQFARQFMELHRTHWPAFEGECEVRPLEQEVQPE
jgi:hypothetical protein